MWNRTPRPEPNFLSSASEVAESAKIIQIFVSDGPALIETIEAMAPAIGPEHIILNHATIAPKETLEAAQLIHDRHARYLDAPLPAAGTPPKPRKSCFSSAAKPMSWNEPALSLRSMPRRYFRIGEIGQAAAIQDRHKLDGGRGGRFLR